MGKTWSDFVDPTVVENNIAQVYAQMAHIAAARAELPLTQEEQQSVAEHLQKLTDSALTVHFSSPKSLLGVLQKGRFFSTMELVTSEPYYTEARQRADVALFGQRGNAPDIIYGFLSQPIAAMSNAAAQYGTTAVVLKEEVKQRATVTRTDTLNALTRTDYDAVCALTVAVPAAKMEAALLPLTPPGAIVSAHTLSELNQTVGNDYFEAQIHGGVTVEDISHVAFRRGTILSEELKQWLLRNNIPFAVK